MNQGGSNGQAPLHAPGETLELVVLPYVNSLKDLE